jgi:hypothetical protein
VGGCGDDAVFAGSFAFALSVGLEFEVVLVLEDLAVPLCAV